MKQPQSPKFLPLIRSVRVIVLSMLHLPLLAQHPVPSKNVFSGRITQIGNVNDDLGTFSGYCSIQVDSVYSNNEILVSGREVQVTMERSLVVDPNSLSDFLNTWEKLKNAEVVVFADHLEGSLQWEKELVIKRMDELNPEEMPKRRMMQWLVVWEIREPQAQHACKLCEAFSEEKDTQVLKILKRELNKGMSRKGGNENGIQAHPCVSWIIPPEAIQLSLPAYSTTLVVMDNGTRRRELSYTIQLGRGSRFFGLIRPKVDRCKLIDVQFRDSLVSAWLKGQHFALKYSLRDGDTLGYPTMPVPDEWLLLRDKYNRPDHHFYNMHPTQEYLWEQSLTALEANKDVFNLCLLSGHIDPEVRLAALKILERVNSVRALPYLLALLEYEIEFDWESLNEAQRNQKLEFRRQLIQTLAIQLKASVHPSTKDLLSSEMLKDYSAFFKSRVYGAELRSF